MKNGRNIRRREVYIHAAGGNDDPLPWHSRDWLVPFREGFALVHHAHDSHHELGGVDGADRHALCGPVLFCCHRSRQRFLDVYPQSVLARAVWARVASDQMISWMDAGVQALYLIYCAPGASYGLAAAALSGRQARQALQKLVPAGELLLGSGQMLRSITYGKFQALDEKGQDSALALSLA